MGSTTVTIINEKKLIDKEKWGLVLMKFVSFKATVSRFFVHHIQQELLRLQRHFPVGRLMQETSSPAARLLSADGGNRWFVVCSIHQFDRRLSSVQGCPSSAVIKHQHFPLGLRYWPSVHLHDLPGEADQKWHFKRPTHRHVAADLIQIRLNCCLLIFGVAASWTSQGSYLLPVLTWLPWSTSCFSCAKHPNQFDNKHGGSGDISSSGRAMARSSGR